MISRSEDLNISMKVELRFLPYKGVIKMQAMNGLRRRRRSINDHMRNLVRFLCLLIQVILLLFLIYVSIRAVLYLGQLIW